MRRKKIKTIQNALLKNKKFNKLTQYKHNPVRNKKAIKKKAKINN